MSPCAHPDLYRKIVKAVDCPRCAAAKGAGCTLTRNEQRHVYDPFHFIHMERSTAYHDARRAPK